MRGTSRLLLGVHVGYRGRMAGAPLRLRKTFLEFLRPTLELVIVDQLPALQRAPSLVVSHASSYDGGTDPINSGGCGLVPMAILEPVGVNDIGIGAVLL
jgi:hypothetical protein